MKSLIFYKYRYIFLTLLLLIGLAAATLAQTTQLPGQWVTNTLSAAKVRAFLINTSSVWAGTSTGIWTTPDNGTTWTQNNAGLTVLDVRALASSGTTYYAGTYGGGVFRSTDGTNWSVLNTGLNNLNILALTVNGSDVFAGTYGGGIYKLSGTTWSAVNTGISSSAQVYTLISSGNDLFAGGQLNFNDPHHIYKSTDKGAHWTATGANSSDASISPPPLVYSMAVKGTTILAATLNGIYRSTDYGVNWQLLSSFPMIGLSLLYTPDGSALYASGLAADGSLYGVSISTDNGSTWRAFSYGLAGSYPLAINNSTVFAGNTYSGGVATASTQLLTAASVSAASFQQINGHSPESIASLFGPGLATGQAAASFIPLPTTLAGTTVTVLDSQGVARPAQLFFVNNNQVNYQVPSGTAYGWSHITITSGNGTVSYATANITLSSFALFTMDSTGSGVPSAYIQRNRANGTQSFEAVGSFNPQTQKWTPLPINLGPETDQVFLVLFGTGIRGWDSSANPIVSYFSSAAIPNLPVPVDFAGPHGTFVGVDQVNIRLPRTLIGAGEVTLYLTANTGPYSNSVKLNIQ